MADLTKTVEIIFGGQDKNLTATTKNIGSQFDTLSGLTDKITGPLAKAADSVLKVDAALLALVAGGLAYAYKKSIEFETAMVSFNKVSDGIPATLLAARDAAFALSTQYGVSATSVLNSSTEFLQAGFNAKEALMLTKTALDLSIAGEISAAEASQFLVTTLKGFKAPAEDAARLTDILNEVSNKYATDVRQLAWPIFHRLLN